MTPLPPQSDSKHLHGIPLLPVTGAAITLAEQVAQALNLPSRARADAVHIAVSAIHGMSFLLTWNCRHLANAAFADKIERTCLEAGLLAPRIVTPRAFDGSAMIEQNQPEADDDDGDPIVAEVRRAREALFAKFGYDLRALGEHLQQRTEEAAHAGRKVVTLPPRRPQPHTPPAKKVG